MLEASADIWSWRGKNERRGDFDEKQVFLPKGKIEESKPGDFSPPVSLQA
jgi:hypothetical protein